MDGMRAGTAITGGNASFEFDAYGAGSGSV
jgi:hypothetical protein